MSSIAYNLLLWFYSLIVNARYLAGTVAMLLLVSAPLCPQTVETGGQRGDAVVTASIDFDDHQPQNTTERAGAELTIVSRPSFAKNMIGRMALPDTPVATRDRPYCSFWVYTNGSLEQTAARFRARIAECPYYRTRIPYIVFAVRSEDPDQPYAYVIGSRAPEYEPDPVPLETWTECVLDHSTLVHVWAYRQGLGRSFTTSNYGLLGDLLETPVGDGRVWGELYIEFVELSAGMWGGAAFEAYVDDLQILERDDR